ncbi:hypothetical protein ACISK3_06695 [Morganella morganii]|nr:hypothetical protein [Morganella morganii]
MRNSLKISIIIAFIAIAIFIYVLPYVSMTFTGSAHYTERDKREYSFFTPEIFKKIPRITNDYDFSFANITGPSALVYAINFYGTDNTSLIDNYLKSIGYKKQPTCDIDAECWENVTSEQITVSLFEKEKRVSVQLYISSYMK